LPETGKAEKLEVEQPIPGNSKDDNDPEDETSEKLDLQQKRKRRVSEDPSSSAVERPTKDKSVDGSTSHLPTLSVTPTTTATMVKSSNVQDDRAKIAEMYSTIKRTINLLIQMCESNFKCVEAEKNEAASKSAKREGASDGSTGSTMISVSGVGDNKPAEPMEEEEAKTDIAKTGCEEQKE
jgi:hypothetical protein